jgi:hypothetical protein
MLQPSLTSPALADRTGISSSVAPALGSNMVKHGLEEALEISMCPTLIRLMVAILRAVIHRADVAPTDMLSHLRGS